MFVVAKGYEIIGTCSCLFSTGRSNKNEWKITIMLTRQGLNYELSGSGNQIHSRGSPRLVGTGCENWRKNYQIHLEHKRMSRMQGKLSSGGTWLTTLTGCDTKNGQFLTFNFPKNGYGNLDHPMQKGSYKSVLSPNGFCKTGLMMKSFRDTLLPTYHISYPLPPPPRV